MGWETESLEYNTVHTRLAFVRDKVVQLGPSSVLELGCSVGLLRQEILSLLPSTDYWACDISSSAVEVVADPRVVVHDLNNDGLPFRDKTWDCVVGSGILEYLDDLPSLLRQTFAALRPGGAVVMTYFNMRHYSRRIAPLRRRRPWRHADFRNDFTPKETVQLFREAGFVGLIEQADHMTVSRIQLPRFAGRLPGKRMFGTTLVYVARKPDLAF
jgi:SAM-dependent methyltransferase